MLILTRKKNNSILIGDDIKVTVIDITENKHGDTVVALGFDAPKHICVDREEVRARRIKHIDEIFKGHGSN